MNRHPVKTVETIPEKYSNGTAVVVAFEGETAVGILHDNGEEAFLIPLSAFEMLVRVFDQYLSHEVERAHMDAAKRGGLN